MTNRSLKKSRLPKFGWILAHSPTYFSCIVEFDEAKVKERIRCARLCRDEKPNFIKFRITEVK